MLVRLAKFISAAGICSRRKAEELIFQGFVVVDNQVVTSPAFKVLEEKNIVKINNKIIKTNLIPRIWLYYKPVGVITSHDDPQKRPTVFGLLHDRLPRVISIGRLDINSEGLLLLTNNSTIAHYMESPRNNIERVYLVRAFGARKIINLSNTEIRISDMQYKVKSISFIRSIRSNAWYKVVLSEGKNREIKKVFASFGLQVNRLIRISYGQYNLDSLKPGKYREGIIPYTINKIIYR